MSVDAEKVNHISIEMIVSLKIKISDNIGYFHVFKSPIALRYDKLLHTKFHKCHE